MVGPTCGRRRPSGVRAAGIGGGHLQAPGQAGAGRVELGRAQVRPSRLEERETRNRPSGETAPCRAVGPASAVQALLGRGHEPSQRESPTLLASATRAAPGGRSGVRRRHPSSSPRTSAPVGTSPVGGVPVALRASQITPNPYGPLLGSLEGEPWRPRERPRLRRSIGGRGGRWTPQSPSARGSPFSWMSRTASAAAPVQRTCLRSRVASCRPTAVQWNRPRAGS